MGLDAFDGSYHKKGCPLREGIDKPGDWDSVSSLGPGWSNDRVEIVERCRYCGVKRQRDRRMTGFFN